LQLSPVAQAKMILLGLRYFVFCGCCRARIPNALPDNGVNTTQITQTGKKFLAFFKVMLWLNA
jgi:hypothetical protein